MRYGRRQRNESANLQCLRPGKVSYPHWAPFEPRYDVRLSLKTDEFDLEDLSLLARTVGQVSGGSWPMSESSLRGKKVVVLGASRGVGREIVRRVREDGAAQVWAVARGREALEHLANELPGIRALVLDAATEDAPRQVFDALRPDVLIICGGATPATSPVQDLSWKEFAANWESDVRMSFLFCREALRAPLAAGSAVILISSGAGLGGSPISGGYAGCKRMQMFLAGYCQKESSRLNLGIRFKTLVPMRIMPETDLGRTATEGYARYLGIKPADFIEGMQDRQSARDVADAVVRIAMDRTDMMGPVVSVSATGLARVA
jgi:NAD(P)-dependent dehydrogenase (short-subunit alcohol dehydrogenase family)